MNETFARQIKKTIESFLVDKNDKESIEFEIRFSTFIDKCLYNSVIHKFKNLFSRY